ncbi:GDSL-type esterase/lipase family protein [Singulisphaera rosea]
MIRVEWSGMGSLVAFVLAISLLGRPSEARGDGRLTIRCDHPDLVLAPYVWKPNGKGAESLVDSTMPGAYLRATFQGTTAIGLVVDGSSNRGCPAPSMPVVEFSVDDGPYRVVPLTQSEGVYTLDVASGLDPTRPHRLTVIFRAADLLQDRWGSPRAHLRIAGISMDRAGVLLPSVSRPRRAIGFGDSITEGVGVDGLFTSWQSLSVNNARATWFPIVALALDCEYGQLGSGGLGMSRALNLPALPQVWDRFDVTTSRLSNGRLLPEPDYILCALGTNDFDKDITTDYTKWLVDVRQACPNSWIFCVVPPLGVHKGEIESATAVRRRTGDSRVHVIDTSPLASAFRAGQGPTSLAHDGVHPSGYGHAMLGALIAVEIRRVLDSATAEK